MTLSLADKARANRRAALASLNACMVQGENVISIFAGPARRRETVPEFHSIRARTGRSVAAHPVLVLTDPVAA